MSLVRGTVFAVEFLSGLTSFEDSRDELLKYSRDYLDAQLESIQQLVDSGAAGRQVVEEITSIFDTLNQCLFAAVSFDLDENALAGCTLIALGGYGRAEMNPRSDLDLMFFYEACGKDAARVISDRMLYLLWDLRLDVGYSVRSADECLEESHDNTVRSALLDARFIAGSSGLFETFSHTVGQTMLSQNTQAYIKLKLEERDERKKKYGSSVYLLEPNLKEGEGGLRELHEALWIARVKFKARNLKGLLKKGVINEQDYQEYEDALDYLWKIRNYLHFHSQRKSDQLTFEIQQQIATAFKYKSSRRTSAVERFMREYYSHAIRVEHLATKIILSATQQRTKSRSKVFGFMGRRNLEDGFYIIRGELRARVDEHLLEDPVLIMIAFELAQKHQVQIVSS